MIDAMKRLIGARALRPAASECAACPDPPIALIMAMTALGMLVGAMVAPVPDTVTSSEQNLGAERVISTVASVADHDN